MRCYSDADTEVMTTEQIRREMEELTRVSMYLWCLISWGLARVSVWGMCVGNVCKPLSVGWLVGLLI